MELRGRKMKRTEDGGAPPREDWRRKIGVAKIKEYGWAQESREEGAGSMERGKAG